MNNLVKSVVLIVLLGGLSACETARGAVIGAGIGHFAGDAEVGARVGATVGLAYDIFG